MGFAEKGKTPVAQAIAMAISEYHIIRNPREKDMQPSFRLCASLDQLRGDSGCVERPDILDDPDTTALPVSKLKFLLDSTLAEVHTVARWTAARFVRNQLRIICDSRVNEDAEPRKGTGYVSLKAFMEMIQPAFPDKASKQDIMACLKRSHWVVNLRHGVYLRPAGTSNDDVMCVSYTDGAVFTGETTRREIKPSLAFSGPDFLGESHAEESLGSGEHKSTDTLPKKLVKVKEEAETATSFPGLLAGSMPCVTDLDSLSPTNQAQEDKRE